MSASSDEPATDLTTDFTVSTVGTLDRLLLEHPDYWLRVRGSTIIQQREIDHQAWDDKIREQEQGIHTLRQRIAKLTSDNAFLTRAHRETLRKNEELRRQLTNPDDELAKTRHLLEATDRLRLMTEQKLANVQAEVNAFREQRVEMEQKHAELSPALADDFHRAESVELVTAMVAGADFELIRDIEGETAMWIQHLPSRPGVQVFLQVTHTELVQSSPAELYQLIRNQVGAS